MDKNLFKESLKNEMLHKYGKTLDEANSKEKYDILSVVIMRLISDEWKQSKEKSKCVRNAYWG